MVAEKLIEDRSLVTSRVEAWVTAVQQRELSFAVNPPIHDCYHAGEKRWTWGTSAAPLSPGAQVALHSS
jgi:hypothetical protein